MGIWNWAGEIHAAVFNHVIHTVEIHTIVPYNDTGKYMIKFKGGCNGDGSDPAPGKL